MKQALLWRPGVKQHAVCVPNKISLFKIIVTLCTLYRARFSPRGSVKLMLAAKKQGEGFMQPLWGKYALHTKYILIKLHTMPHSDWHPTFRQSDSCVFFSVSCSGWYPIMMTVVLSDPIALSSLDDGVVDLVWLIQEKGEDSLTWHYWTDNVSADKTDRLDLDFLFMMVSHVCFLDTLDWPVILWKRLRVAWC